MKKGKYLNLEAEIARAKINRRQLADEVGISQSSFYAKLKGRADFRLEECYKLTYILAKKNKKKLSLDYLFKRGE